MGSDLHTRLYSSPPSWLAKKYSEHSIYVNTCLHFILKRTCYRPSMSQSPGAGLGPNPKPNSNLFPLELPTNVFYKPFEGRHEELKFENMESKEQFAELLESHMDTLFKPVEGATFVDPIRKNDLSYYTRHFMTRFYEFLKTKGRSTGVQTLPSSEEYYKYVLMVITSFPTTCSPDESVKKLVDILYAMMHERQNGLPTQADPILKEFTPYHVAHLGDGLALSIIQKYRVKYPERFDATLVRISSKPTIGVKITTATELGKKVSDAKGMSRATEGTKPGQAEDPEMKAKKPKSKSDPGPAEDPEKRKINDDSGVGKPIKATDFGSADGSKKKKMKTTTTEVVDADSSGKDGKTTLTALDAYLAKCRKAFEDKKKI